MFFPNELWIIIKYFLFHDIKFSKHLKNDPNIKKFNQVINNLPKRLVPRYGPRIMYYPRKNTYRYYYNIKIKTNIYTKIIIISNLPKDYLEKFEKYDKQIRINYYNSDLFS